MFVPKLINIYFAFSYDHNRCYGGGHSLRGWQRDRLATSFETKESAKKRTEQLNCQPAQKKAKKNHVGKFEASNWDKENLLEEVRGYEDGKVVSWRALATRYNVCNNKGVLANNGGQMVKEYVISQDLDITKFRTSSQHIGDQEIVRKRKRRSVGGEISIPTEPTPAKLRQMLAEKLSSGEYTIGEMIVPKKVC